MAANTFPLWFEHGEALPAPWLDLFDDPTMTVVPTAPPRVARAPMSRQKACEIQQLSCKVAQIDTSELFQAALLPGPQRTARQGEIVSLAVSLDQEVSISFWFNPTIGAKSLNAFMAARIAVHLARHSVYTLVTTKGAVHPHLFSTRRNVSLAMPNSFKDALAAHPEFAPGVAGILALGMRMAIRAQTELSDPEGYYFFRTYGAGPLVAFGTGHSLSPPMCRVVRLVADAGFPVIVLLRDATRTGAAERLLAHIGHEHVYAVRPARGGWVSGDPVFNLLRSALPVSLGHGMPNVVTVVHNAAFASSYYVCVPRLATSNADEEERVANSITARVSALRFDK